MINHRIESARCVQQLAWLIVLCLLPSVVLSQPISQGDNDRMAVAPAQTSQERIVISGTVQDPTGALVTGASVTLIHVEMKQTFTATTRQDGAFSFSEKIPAGPYRLLVARPGFKEFDSGRLQLSADKPTQVDVLLDIAPIYSRIEMFGLREPQPTVPAKPRRVSTGVISGSPLRMVQAEYPLEARAQGIEGRVVIEAVVDTSGQVISASAIEGHPLLVEAALAAAKKWRYRPPLLNDQPVMNLAVITMDFSLGETKMEISEFVPAAGSSGYGRPTILHTPRPAWTPEAREKRIQGRIILSAVFAADGTIQDVRVFRGLGYGLDEKAVEAAKKIAFTPAKDSSGKPVSVRATIRIEFNLL